ncbi:hypothetical protein NBRC13296_02320 [Paenibacillus chitinolyticus]|uniref:hypothetical protein n=1 Tax=Paenibacillus chitinolyticus TaxID=79263 RepID=UPI003555C02C
MKTFLSHMPARVVLLICSIIASADGDHFFQIDERMIPTLVLYALLQRKITAAINVGDLKG